MPLRKVRDADDARLLLEQSDASGAPRAIWARKHGVDPRSLNAWRVNLARAERTRARPLRLVEWVAPPAPALTVRVGPFAVAVDAHFDEDHLRRLLAALASC